MNEMITKFKNYIESKKINFNKKFILYGVNGEIQLTYFIRNYKIDFLFDIEDKLVFTRSKNKEVIECIENINIDNCYKLFDEEIKKILQDEEINKDIVYEA